MIFQFDNKNFQWKVFANWIEKIGFKVPFAVQIFSSRIPRVDAERMLMDDKSRIDKVERNPTHKLKYKFDRHNKSYKLGFVDFKNLLGKLLNNDSHLYVKYVVGGKENIGNNYKQENLTLYFGGITESSGSFLMSSAKNFHQLNTNGTFSKVGDDDIIKNDTSFKDKNNELFTTDGYNEFNECKISGVIHHIISGPFDSYLGVLTWLNGLGNPRHIYIKMSCNKKQDKPSETDPTVVRDPNETNPCDVQQLTSPIFTTDSNLKISLLPPTHEYYDVGQGCCP